jgi:hypothetical protein
MGVVEGVRQAELVVSDVEASMAQAQEMTAILNAPMTTNITVTDEDLDAELGLLLEEEEESITIPLERHCASASPAMPSGEKASVNKMSKIEEEEEAMV